jgi:hypothetical protein
MSVGARLYARLLAAFALLAYSPAGAAAADLYVPAGGDLQAALDTARPGDTIRLEPGATYVGNFRLPAHGGTTYVTLRSGAPDGQLPGAGARMSPAYAAKLPKLRSPNTQPALATRPGASYWRLMFLEIQATDRGYYDIVTLGDGSGAQTQLAQVPQQLIVDRVYIHGDPLHGQKRGIALNSGATTIRNSYIAGIRAVGQDSQAIAGWNGPGPYTIENNYLEAAGEVFILGGSDPAIPNLVTSDVVVRQNTLTRPVSWRNPILAPPPGVRASAGTGGSLPAGTYGYRVVAYRQVGSEWAVSAASAEAVAAAPSGGRVTIAWDPVPDAAGYLVYGRTAGNPAIYWNVSDTTFTDVGSGGTPGSPGAATVWQVKNLLELKNARRVLITGNLLTNNWAQAQVGVAVLFTPRNQDGGCPWCVVEDVTFEYNVMRGVGGGFTILGWDNENPSQQTNNIRIRHNEVSDISDFWSGTGYFLDIMGEPRNVTVDHNTIISPDGTGVVSVSGPPIGGFVFTNNVARHNLYGIIGADHAPGLHTIQRFFPDGVITRNVLAGNLEGIAYPPGNEFPSVAAFEAHFVDYAAGNYALKPGTDWQDAGTDGEDLGANIPRDTKKTPAKPSNPRVVK